MKVCLVDDERDITELLGSFLSFNGLEVAAFNDPVAALARLKGEDFDAVVVDLTMPGMDGTQLIAALRSEPRHARTRLFVLSSKSLGPEESASLSAAGARFVSKPFELRSFLELLRGSQNL